MANQDVYYQGPNGAYKKFQHIGNGFHAEVQSVMQPDEIAFYAGREFRTFKEYSIAGASAITSRSYQLATQSFMSSAQF
jgi:hypothetical protein